MNDVTPDNSPGIPDADAVGLPPKLWRDAALVFAAGLAVYLATCAPDVLMGDSGVYQLRVPSFPPFPPLKDALVQVHPLYLIIAKVFTWLPMWSVAYRVNLVSPLFGAITLASVFVGVRLLTGSRWAAAIGTLSAGLGHTFWAFAVVAECLTLASAFLTTELVALMIFARTGRTRWFMIAALLNGLSISNHMLGALATPVYAVLAVVWVRRGRLTWGEALTAAGLWLFGTGLYLVVILLTLLDTGDLLGVIRSATTGNWPALNVTITPSLVGKVAAYVGLQYPTLLVLLAVVAGWVAPVDERYRPIKWAVFGVVGLLFIFASRYPRPDQYSFFVSCWAAMGLLVGLGAWAMVRRWRWTRWAGVVLAVAPIGVYAVLPDVARRLELNPFTRALPYRDPYEFFLKPWQQGNDGVRRYVSEAFRDLPPDAILFGDPTPAGAFLYVQQIEGQRLDLKFAWIWDDRPLETLLWPTFPPRWRHPVYTVANDAKYAPAAFVRDCELVPKGVLYEVKPPKHFPKSPWR